MDGYKFKTTRLSMRKSIYVLVGLKCSLLSNCQYGDSCGDRRLGICRARCMFFVLTKTKNKRTLGTIKSLLEGNKVRVRLNGRIESAVDIDVSFLSFIAKGYKCVL